MNRRNFLRAAIIGIVSASLRRVSTATTKEADMEATAQLPSQASEGSFFKAKYHHETMEGTSYDVGKMQGEFLKETGRGIFSYEPPDVRRDFRVAQQLYEEFCPGLNDEIQGVADGLGVPPEKVVFCAVVTPGCSHMVALPSMTQDHHLYVARSYDMSPGDSDLRLCTTRVKGKAAHIGFSELICGRNDGLNNSGLCVTMSRSWADVPEEHKLAKGFHYAFGVRSVLDNCRTTSEAVELLQRLPIGGAVNIMVADRSGTAALVEIAGGKHAAKTISKDTLEQHLISTNHYTLLDISNESPNTTTRYTAAETWLKANVGRVSKEALRGFLAKEYPEGFCGYSIEHQIGSLWSLVVDVSDGTVEVRFGPPPYNNEWHMFTLEDAVGIREYTATFPRKNT